MGNQLEKKEKKKPKRLGRKLKLNNDLTERIAQFIRAGSYAYEAAAANGIGRRSYYTWIERGEEASQKIEEYNNKLEVWEGLTEEEQKQSPELEPTEEEEPTEDDLTLSHFARTIKKADAEGEAALLLEIKKDKSWQSKAWILERRHRERWGRAIEVSGQIDQRHSIEQLDPDLIEEKRNEFLQLGSSPAIEQTITEIIDAEVEEVTEEEGVKGGETNKTKDISNLNPNPNPKIIKDDKKEIKKGSSSDEDGVKSKRPEGKSHLKITQARVEKKKEQREKVKEIIKKKKIDHGQIDD